MRRLGWLLAWCASAVSAAPQLRLTNSTVYVQVAPGATAANQTLYAYNIGDGSLSLNVSVQPGITWVAASLGPIAQSCPIYIYPPGPCFPLQFAFNTKDLAQGAYTAEVEVSDPNAIDAPQFVVVTVSVGSPAPLALDEYVAPGSKNDAGLHVTAPCGGIHIGCAQVTATTQDNGTWLVITTDNLGNGCFVFPEDVWIHLAPPARMRSGTYHGSVTIAAGTIPVTMRVTRLPIAVASPAQLSVKLATGGPAVTSSIALTNRGMGTLVVPGVAASIPEVNASWAGDHVAVTVDPKSLAPGTYSGAVTIQCDAANCPVVVPLNVEIIPQGPPVIYYQGIMDLSASYPSQPVVQGDFTMAKGEQLSLAAPQSLPVMTELPTTLGGASVLVNGVAAPLLSTSFSQIVFQMPVTTAPGVALVQVQRDGQIGNTVSVNVVARVR